MEFAPNSTERLIVSLAEDISPEITNAQLAEVRRRIRQVEFGDEALIPGDAWRESEVCWRNTHRASRCVRGEREHVNID